MSKPGSLALSLAVAGLATPCFASSSNLLETSGCSPALTEHYGEEATFTLVSRRKSREGWRLKVAVRTSADNSGNWNVRYVFCQVPRGNEGEVTIEDVNPGPTAAPQ